MLINTMDNLKDSFRVPEKEATWLSRMISENLI
jgi:hypothetical protein